MVQVLPAEAPARAAHGLAAAACRGDVPAGPLEAAPLPPPQPVDAGPARLHFHGHEHVLRGRPFLLGHHPTCDLVLDAALYPAVAARHCEVVYEGRAYVLRDRGSQAVWVNGRPVVQQLPLHPGDWIRLGIDGPLLRFMGQPIALAGNPRTAVGG
jgi:pSer/pThr/pTyr-binding forkhead associated (FHA) protein